LTKEDNMLDVNKPEFSVEEILQRIQERVRSRHQRTTAVSSTGSPATFVTAAWNRIDEQLALAQQSSYTGAYLPSMTRMRGPLRPVAGMIAKLFLRAAQLITRDQRSFNSAALEVLRSLYSSLKDDAASLRDNAARISALGGDLSVLRTELSQTQARVAELQAAEVRARQEAESSALQVSNLRTSLSLLERRVHKLLEVLRNRPPEALATEELRTMAATPAWEASYLHFEDKFRGSREEIKRRVTAYIPKLRAAAAVTENSPILDLGCGRGELLEALREANMSASGVDINPAAIEQCRKYGLSVDQGDLFEALSKIPDASLGGITALHLVEHLPFPLVLNLLDESLRVLRPGGIAIFETPNPKNVLVGSSEFYIDPTHRNPVHPRTLHYLLEARGMVRVETVMLHPWPPESRVPDADSELARRFNDYFYGPQDYAAVGYRS
jgi:O-antigen chain-terminating methyltransferase